MCTSQSNSPPVSAGANARVRFWYRWWWVLTRPGVTRQPRASIVRTAAGRGSAEDPIPLISPSVTATQPPGISRRASSTVATRSASVTSRSAGAGCMAAILPVRRGAAVPEDDGAASEPLLHGELRDPALQVGGHAGELV